MSAAIGLALALCLLLPAGALGAESGTSTNGGGTPAKLWAKGTVRASDTIRVYAPIGGEALPLDVEAGDDVAQGDVLVSVRPGEVSAPFDGTVLIQHAREGDRAEDVAQAYGALCYLQREDIQWLRTTTATAYNDAENRDIRVGEVLRVFNGKTYNRDKREETGRVVAIDGDAFVVEFAAGTFDIEEEIRVYRGSGDDYKDADIVGRGKAERVPPIAVGGQGIVAAVLAQDGQSVRRGQALYYMDAADSRHEEAAQTIATAGEGGVLSALYVQGGQQVRQGQLLAEVTPLDRLECAVDVDELDVMRLPVGHIVQVKLDAQPELMQTATVTRIAPIGKELLDTTKYEATLVFATDVPGLLPGMHITAYWE